MKYFVFKRKRVKLWLNQNVLLFQPCHVPSGLGAEWYNSTSLFTRKKHDYRLH